MAKRTNKSISDMTARKANPQRAGRATKRADPFYLSPEWRALRRLALIRDRYRCVICHADVAAKGAATVDHILPRSTHPHLELALPNVRTLCTSRSKGGNGCDNQGHREKAAGGTARDERFVIRGIDRDGNPRDPNHPWRRE